MEHTALSTPHCALIAELDAQAQLQGCGTQLEQLTHGDTRLTEAHQSHSGM